MKLKEFMEQYNLAPLCVEDIADAAIKVTDCKKLKMAAKKYLESYRKFEQVLEEIEFEIG